MPALEAADDDTPSPAGDYVRHPLLALFRPSVLAVLAIFLALELPGFFMGPALHACLAALVVVMYVWQFARHQPSFMEAVGMILIGSGFGYVVTKGAFTAAFCILFLAVSWLVITWLARRWPLLRGLTALAVFLLVLQVSLSTAYPAWQPESHVYLHLSLDLASFSLLVLIAFASSRTWHEERLVLPNSQLMAARRWATASFLALATAYVLARHTAFSPTYANHAVALSVVLVAWKSRLWLWQSPTLRWLSPALLIMPVNQVALGLYMTHGSHPSPWIPTIIGINALAILALALIMTASVWAAQAPTRSQGEQLTAGKRPPAV